MSGNKNWQFELEEYIRQGEPEQIEKSKSWQTAIGLQAVDGLKTSAYLLDTAKAHIEGKINIDEGVFEHAGRIRTYNITKREWILRGETVIYSSWNSIKETLDYDFATEKKFSYEGLTMEETVRHLAKFSSDIWQIHPFCEGNTRATAVFMIKYMKSFGFDVNNDAFEHHSWYFRNALVRANYNDLKNGIHATGKFLEQFFSNLLLGTEYELKNRYMHVDYESMNKHEEMQGANSIVSKCQNDTLDGTLEISLSELAILKWIMSKPQITQAELAEKTGKSLRTIKREISELQEKGYVRRVNGKRYGKWEVLVDIE